MTYLDAVMASVPRDYWKLDEFGSTVTALNTTGTVVGHYIAAPTLTVPGPLKLEDDSAVSFNAPDVQFVDISGASVVSLTQFSVEFWVKGASQSGAVVYSETSSSGSALFTFACSATNKLVVTIVDDSAATKLALTSTATVFDGNWHHVVFTSDVGLYRLYVDAVQSNTSTYTPGTLTINASALATEIHDAGNLNYFTGSIDEVATYASILSAADIATHYRAAFTTFVMVDALLKKPNITYSVQVDAKLKKRLSVAVDALLVNPAGTFRGTGTTAERDALVALQAKDTWINTEAKQQQYWTGSAWLSAGSIASPSSGQDQNIMAPTTAGWRAEMGDATYPIRYWNGTTAKFTVDNAGNVIAIGTVTAGSFLGGSIDIPDTTTANSFHVASDGKHWSGANASNYATAPFRVSAAGAVTATSATITGTVTGSSVVGSTIDVPDTTTAASFHVDSTGRHWSGTNAANFATAPFRVDASGNVTATSATISGGITGASIDIPSVGGTGFHVASTGETGWGGTTAAAGTLHVDASTGDLSVGGNVTLTGSFGNLRTASSGKRIEIGRPSSTFDQIRFYDGVNTNSGAVAVIQGLGIAGTSMTLQLVSGRPDTGAPDYANSVLRLVGAASGSTSTLLSTDSLEIDGETGTSWFFYAGTAGYASVPVASSAPSTPANTAINLYARKPGSNSILYWKGSDGVEHDLSAAGSMATDTLWDALGDLAYGSGADTGAKLAGQTTTTKQFLSQTGNGTISAAPTWSTIDLSTSSVTGILAAARFPALTGDVTTSSGVIATTIANDAVTYAKFQNIATDSLLGRDTAGTGDPENILLNATLSMDGSGNLQRAALTGDVTASAGSNATTLAAGSASNLNSGTLSAGRMPALTGDVTTSAGAVATTIANNAVSYAKMQDVSATSRFLGRITAGAGDPEELTAANAKTILALQASDLSDNANLAKLNAGNTFTVTPQTLTIDAAGHVGLQINLAASQTARAIQVTDSDGVQAFQMAGSGADILISQYAASPQISGRRAEGTNLLPTAVAADSIGLGLGFRGYGTSFATQDKANIALTAAELWSATAQGTYIDFTTTKKAGTTRTAYFRMTDDGGFRLAEVATPANPASGFGLLYAGTDSLPHYINDGPINFNLSASTATPITTDATAAAAGTRTNPLSPDDHRHQLGAHGDASHTDTTRSMQQWSVENFVLDSGTSVTIGAAPTAIASVNLADAATQGFYFDFLVPADWASGAITAYIYWSPGTTDSNAAHTVRWQFAVTEVTAASTDLTAAASSTTAWTGTAQAHTINLQYTDSNTLLTPNAANRLVKVNVRRLGSDAADTYVGAVRVTTMRLEYTATR